MLLLGEQAPETLQTPNEKLTVLSIVFPRIWTVL